VTGATSGTDVRAVDPGVAKGQLSTPRSAAPAEPGMMPRLRGQFDGDGLARSNAALLIGMTRTLSPAQSDPSPLAYRLSGQSARCIHSCPTRSPAPG
jgi:hypothetical protein